MPNSDLKGFVYVKLESKPDTGPGAVVWSGWVWKYRQVVKHSNFIFVFLGQSQAGNVFRTWWEYGGSIVDRPSQSQL